MMWRRAAVALAIVVGACSGGGPEPLTVDDLVGDLWLAETISGPGRDFGFSNDYPRRGPSLRFVRNGVVEASDGCNDGGGSFAFVDGLLTAQGSGGWTIKDCLGGIPDDVELMFQRAWREPERLIVTGDSMTVVGQGVTIELRRIISADQPVAGTRWWAGSLGAIGDPFHSAPAAELIIDDGAGTIFVANRCVGSFGTASIADDRLVISALSTDDVCPDDDERPSAKSQADHERYVRFLSGDVKFAVDGETLWLFSADGDSLSLSPGHKQLFHRNPETELVEHQPLVVARGEADVEYSIRIDVDGAYSLQWSDRSLIEVETGQLPNDLIDAAVATATAADFKALKQSVKDARKACSKEDAPAVSLRYPHWNNYAIGCEAEVARSDVPAFDAALAAVEWILADGA